MRYLTLLILLNFGALYAQDPAMPFELERYPERLYAAWMNEHAPPFAGENEALACYLSAYKMQRAQNPSDYFPAPGANRKEAMAFLKSHFPDGEALSLIRFLESAGSTTSAQLLLAYDAPKIKAALPYRFVAAMLLDDYRSAREVLDKMDQAQMLSPVLKAFGQNAVNSAANERHILTQGLQDLIAVAYATNLQPEYRIDNRFLDRCAASAKKAEIKSNAMQSTPLWVSPTIDPAGIGACELQGIGLLCGDEPKSLGPQGKWEFAGIDVKPQTPADRGLILSYRYLLQLLRKHPQYPGVVNPAQTAASLEKYINNEGF